MRFALTDVKAIFLAALIMVSVGGNRAMAADRETLTVAGGCFWCVEADFERVPGVIEAVSGFTGGTVSNPTYKQVTRGGTGHYEAVQIEFDPAKVSREQLLHMFLRSIDATDAGGQFCDRGNSYRTAIFVSDQAEKTLADAAIRNAQAELDRRGAAGTKIVTPVLQAGRFYPVDDYHQDYYKQTKTVLTRFGPISKAKAYKRYRAACGRDKRVRALWGDAAPFAGS